MATGIKFGPRFDTIAVHGAYSAEVALRDAGGSVIEPIFASTSQSFASSDEMEEALAYRKPAWAYSRIHNPTIGYLEATVAALEAYQADVEASALCTSSGMSAIKQAIEPLLVLPHAGHCINFVSSAQVYGGTFQLFSERMSERGAVPRWVCEPWDITQWEEFIDEDTRFLYVEVPSNPQQSFVCIDSLAKLAHSHSIPLIVDSTVATPALCRPLEWGADIVVQSLTKTMGSSGAALGGAVIAKHDLTSRHLTDEQKENYAMWLKLLPFRDSGPCMSPMSAFSFLCDIRTLRSKMELFSNNTVQVVDFLDNHPKVAKTHYLGLYSHPLHRLAGKYMMLADTCKSMYGHLCCFEVEGGIQPTRDFFDKLQMIMRATDLGRVKSIATIPAISTHQQQGEAGRCLAGVSPNMVRLCVGGENYLDIIADLEQALG